MKTQRSEFFALLDGFEMTKSQHDWLERRFENMTAKECLLFRGAMQIENPKTTDTAMLLANELDTILCSTELETMLNWETLF